MKTADINSFSNVFEEIGKRWMLITAEKDGKVNTMTASWGGLGIMWGLPVAYVVIRPQRYTREFLDASDKFTASFYSEEYRPALNLCGVKSGRDCDKIAEAGLTTVRSDNGFTWFEQADDVLCLKKLYVQQFEESSFIYPEIHKANYPKKDFHFLYIGEIEEYMTKTL
ncbi:MAG: flavin reductase [Oscillospiraceae bacterium]|nr:flavin reductase [Oscillospiraceae bacterium]